MPLPTSQREESAPEAFEEQAVDAPGIGLCARPPEVEYDEPVETTKRYRQPAVTRFVELVRRSTPPGWLQTQNFDFICR
jgi:hypothetical protein